MWRWEVKVYRPYRKTPRSRFNRRHAQDVIEARERMENFGPSRERLVRAEPTPRLTLGQAVLIVGICIVGTVILLSALAGAGL